MTAQAVLFEDGSDTPLFTGMPIPWQAKDPAPRVQPGAQPLLLEVDCRTCMDTGLLTVGSEKKYCWCAAGLQAWADHK